MHNAPDSRCPRRITTVLSCLSNTSPTSSTCHADRLPNPTSGNNNPKSCLPVHRGVGFITAGWGITPSKLGRCINRFIISALSRNVSLAVNMRAATRASWTIPITGLLACMHQHTMTKKNMSVPE